MGHGKILLWSGYSQMGAASGIRDPTPDLRVSDVVVPDQPQEIHLDPIVERDTDRARLPASPADPLNLRIAVVKRPRPFLAERGIELGSDSLVEPEGTGCNSHQVQHLDGQPGAHHADPPSRAWVEETCIPESLRHRSHQRSRCVPYRSIRMKPRRRRVVVETHARHRSIGALSAPRSVGTVVETDEPATGLKIVRGRIGGQDPRR